MNLREHFRIWRKEHFPAAGASDPSADIRTDSGIGVDPLYIPDDLDYLKDLGFPGEYPFTRGVYPTMYRGKLWTMRQYAGFASATESNKRYRYLLDHGTTGLSVAFDLPTQIGYDSDHPLAEGEVGRVGVAIDSLADMETLFDRIPLETVSTSMTINATAAILLCMYVAVAKKQKCDTKKLAGTVQNDILKEYVARGTHIFPPAPSMRLVTDTFAWCAANLPRWNPISISGYHIREAGATAVEELAFTLANAAAYVRAATGAGLSIDDFGPHLSFFFAIHNNFFEEIAKFRAARRMWASITKETFGASNPEAMKLRFHAQTAGSTLTAQQADNNIPRVTLQALAAALGGCQSLHTNSRDEALALPTEESARIAVRTQQIIAHESGAADTADPLGGSYFVEHLTTELERGARELIGAIDSMGGAVAAIEKGYYQSRIAKSAYEYQKAVEEKRKIIVGVNEYPEKENIQPELQRIDPEVRERQIRNLKELKTRRSTDQVTLALGRLRDAAAAKANVLPAIMTAVECYATVGEISDALRDVWGEYHADHI